MFTKCKLIYREGGIEYDSKENVFRLTWSNDRKERHAGRHCEVLGRIRSSSEQEVQWYLWFFTRGCIENMQIVGNIHRRDWTFFLCSKGLRNVNKANKKTAAQPEKLTRRSVSNILDAFIIQRRKGRRNGQVEIDSVRSANARRYSQRRSDRSGNYSIHGSSAQCN